MGREESFPNALHQHGTVNRLKALTHHGTRVAGSTGAALVVDGGVPLCCGDRRSGLHVLIRNKQSRLNSYTGRLRPLERTLFIPTCYNVSDWFDERGEGGDVGLPVLPHRLPYHQAAGQSKGQVRLLGKKSDVFRNHIRRGGFFGIKPFLPTIQSSCNQCKEHLVR